MCSLLFDRNSGKCVDDRSAAELPIYNAVLPKLYYWNVSKI